MEVGCEVAGEIGDGAGSAGSAVYEDDGEIACAVGTDFDRFAVHGKLSRESVARGVSTDVTGVWVYGKCGWGRRI